MSRATPPKRRRTAGPSPIYTIQTVFQPERPHPVPLTPDNLYGAVSVIFWSGMIIVTSTYVSLVMRAGGQQR